MMRITSESVWKSYRVTHTALTWSPYLRLGSRPVRRKAGSSPSHGDKSEGHSFDVVIESQITTPISTKTKPKKETPLNQGNTKKQAAAGYSSQAR
jgi:hypothetical protein